MNLLWYSVGFSSLASLLNYGMDLVAFNYCCSDYSLEIALSRVNGSWFTINKGPSAWEKYYWRQKDCIRLTDKEFSKPVNLALFHEQHIYWSLKFTIQIALSRQEKFKINIKVFQNWISLILVILNFSTFVCLPSIGIIFCTLLAYAKNSLMQYLYLTIRHDLSILKNFSNETTIILISPNFPSKRRWFQSFRGGCLILLVASVVLRPIRPSWSVKTSPARWSDPQGVS